MASDMNTVIGVRLSQVRKSLGLSLEEVCRQTNIGSYQTLSKIEKGDRPIKVAELSRLCRLFSKDLSFFLSERMPDTVRPVFAWRAKPDDQPARMAQARIEQLLMNYKLLEELTEEVRTAEQPAWPKVTAKLDRDYVANQAEILIKDYNLGYRPSVNLVDVVEERLNIKVVFLSLGDSGSGVSGVGEFGQAIVINSQEVPWRRNFNLAHELFHLLAVNYYPLEKTHKSLLGRRPWEEKLADSFAAALLMPRESVLQEVRSRAKNNRVDWIELIKVAEEFGVSIGALLIRLSRLGVLQSDRVDKMLKSDKLKSINREARSGGNMPAEEFSPRFVWLGLKALKRRRLSMGKFCQIFGIRRTEFDDFIGRRGDLKDFCYDSELPLVDTRR